MPSAALSCRMPCLAAHEYLKDAIHAGRQGMSEAADVKMAWLSMEELTVSQAVFECQGMHLDCIPWYALS